MFSEPVFTNRSFVSQHTILSVGALTMLVGLCVACKICPEITNYMFGIQQAITLILVYLSDIAYLLCILYLYCTLSKSV